MDNLSATPLPPPKRGGRSTTILVVADVLNHYETDLELSKVIVNDFVLRDEFGFNKHHQNLETHDGRPTIWDLYQELLDADQYNRKLIEEGAVLPGMEGVYETLLDLTRCVRKAMLDADIVRNEHEEALEWSINNENDTGQDPTTLRGVEPAAPNPHDLGITDQRALHGQLGGQRVPESHWPQGMRPKIK